MNLDKKIIAEIAKFNKVNKYITTKGFRKFASECADAKQF